MYWRRFSAWCGAQKRFWLYTRPMRTVSHLGVSYPQLEAFYTYTITFFVFLHAIPWVIILTWSLVGFACTWHPSRKCLPQELCLIRAFQQPSNSSWPIDRFYQTNGSEQGAARYLEMVMIGPAVLADHTVAIHQQRKKIEKSPYSQGSRLPRILVDMERSLDEFHPRFERFSLSLCHALDEIHHGFWIFLGSFDKYTSSMNDHPHMNLSSIIFYPWYDVLRLVNSELNSTNLPEYRPYRERIEREVIYEFDRFYARSITALDDIGRGFLAHDLPKFVEKMTPLLQTYDQSLASEMGHIDGQRNEALTSRPLFWQLASYLGFGLEALDSLNKYRALHRRNDNRLGNVEDALYQWNTYIAQLREQIFSLRHLFQKRTSAVDFLFHRVSSVGALMEELKGLRNENGTEEVAARFAHVVRFTMPIGRLHDMIAGVSSGLEESSCLAEKIRATKVYAKKIGNDPANVVKKLLDAHKRHKKGKPLPDFW